MRAQAHRAGPGRNRFLARPVSVEAAGPASPRLGLEEVRFRVSADSAEAAVTLAFGSQRFTGRAGGGGSDRPTWKLAAAATVAATQQYLQHTVTDRLAPHIALADLATATTGLGDDVIHATVTLVNGSQQTQLLGSALVRNDWCSTAVAAALDATNRQLSRFAFRPEAADEVVQECPPQSTDPPRAQVTPPEEVRHVPAATRVREPDPGEHMGPELPIEPSAEPAVEAAPPTPEPTFARAAPAGADAALGIEIGATSVRAAAVDAEGRVLAEERRPSRPTGEPDLTLDMAVDAARATIASLNSSAGRLGAIGVTMPGRLRPGDGVCVSCGDFPAWRDVPVSEILFVALDLPVALIGATQAAALAEWQFGAAQGLSNLLLVAIGVEIDVAVISDGRPLMLGDAGPGQAGHMVVAPGGPRCSCGESGCWQAVAGRDALVARVVRDIGGGIPSAISAVVENRLGAITPALVCQMAAIGDNVAKNALEETGRFLAIGVGNLITLFDPEAVILDSAPSQVAAELRRVTAMALKTSRRAHVLSRSALLSPTLGDAARVLGAAAWATRTLAQPSHAAV